MKKLMIIAVLACIGFASMPNSAYANRKRPTGTSCSSQGKAFSKIGSETECARCGGEWTVSTLGCGGRIVSGALTTIGGLVTLNPFAIGGGIFTLWKAKKSCDGHCEAKA